MIEPLFKLDLNGTAVVTDAGRCVSYAELKRLSDGWAAKLPPRSLVFLLVGNNLDSLVAYVSCLNHDIVPLMLDARIDGQLLQRFVEIYRPDFIWRPTEDGYCLVEGCSASDVGHPELFGDLALLLTTSGSTGSPKLVRQADWLLPIPVPVVHYGCRYGTAHHLSSLVVLQ